MKKDENGRNEYAVGEIFECDGKKFVVKNGSSCSECALHRTCLCDEFGCMPLYRSDNENVVAVLVEDGEECRDLTLNEYQEKAIPLQEV